MKSNQIRVLGATFIIVLTLVGVAVASVQSVHWVRVPESAFADLADLGLQPRFEVDYGSFWWLELEHSDFARLAASSLPFAEVADAGEVRVMDRRFDPVLEGEPAVSAARRADDRAVGLRLLQLVGPSNDEWIETLEQGGLRLLQYYPHNTYLVWSGPDETEAAVKLPFVRWHGLFHPAYKLNADLRGRSGSIRNVDVMFYNDGDVDGVLRALGFAGAEVIQHHPSQPDKAFFDAIVVVDGEDLEAIAAIPQVLWLGYASPEATFDDEMSDQIIAGNYVAGVPFPGYLGHLATLGFDGSGVIWATIDTGVDYGHPDLNTHIVGGYSFPGAPSGNPGDDCAGGGHGTHVTGIIGGDAAAGYDDANDFLYGLGVAPAYSIFAMNSLCTSPWPPSGGWQEHSKQAVLGNAVGGNNSWTTSEGTQHGYQASERTHDLMVRDGNFDTAATAEPFIEVFSAGNSGSSGLTAPKEAKNLIVVAGTRNYRAGAIDTMYGSSSVGPAVDGRWVPTIAAPAESIISAHRLAGASQCTSVVADTANHYSYCTGTSMAAPHASGSVVLITQWWRSFNSGLDPSPAMAKALLINDAVDIGTADIPNIYEGWGRINITNTLAPTVFKEYMDQEQVFTDTGETWTFLAGVPDTGAPLKITLAWSDAAGAAGANPALVNNLDLEVVTGGTTYLGNDFAAGWSTTGGSADVLNNQENVFVAPPAVGSTVEITVRATNIAGDGVPYTTDSTDQDFALVCSNCALEPGYGLSMLPTTLSLCAGDDAVFDIQTTSILGYSDPVGLTVAGEPAGTMTLLDPDTVTPGDASTLTISNTGAVGFGSYAVTLTGTSTVGQREDTSTLWVYESAAAAPTPVAPVDGATDVEPTPTLEWSAVAEAASYLVEVALDSGFATIIYSAPVADISYILPAPLDFATEHFWRVTSVNPCGSGAASATFSFTTRAVPAILLVDDDDNSPDVRSYYTDALDALGYSYDLWDTNNSDDEPDAATLSWYQQVLWFTGDEFGGAAGPGNAGEAALATYLDGGGRFFMSSQDYLYDRGLTTFGSTYLGVASYTSDVNQTTVTGANVFAGFGPYALSYPVTNYSDVVVPDATALLAFSGNNGDAAVSKEAAPFRTVFFGFPFEAVASATDRNELMERILNFGDSTGTIAGTVALTPVRADTSGTVVEAREMTGGTLVDSTVTDAAGGYSLDLPPDSYTVSVEMDLYLDSVQAGISLLAGSTVTLTDVTLIGGDINGDDTVELVDVTSVAGNFGSSDPAYDINASGTVDIVDVSAAASAYGSSSPVPWP